MPISFQYQQSRLFPLELIDADDNESIHIKPSQPSKVKQAAMSTSNLRRPKFPKT